jgi:hypothetical protein
VTYNSAANQYLVVWVDSRNSPTDIYGQRLKAFGRQQGNNFRISGPAATGKENYPTVAYNSVANQYLVTWYDWRRNSISPIDIFGQRLSASGARLGSNFRINGSAPPAYEGHPYVVHNSAANQYLVVWQDSRNYSTRGSDIYGRRISTSGARLGIKFRISGSAATSNEYEPSVAYNSAANQYLVVWADGRNVGSRGDDIYGQRWSP